MNDILERLRADEQYQWRSIMQEAAAEIDRLRGLLGSTTTPATGGAVIHLANEDVVIRVVRLLLSTLDTADLGHCYAADEAREVLRRIGGLA